MNAPISGPLASARPWASRAGGSQVYRVTVAVAGLTCALTPAYTVRWHVGAYATTVLEVSILLTVGVFAVETLQHRGSLHWPRAFIWPAVLFLLAGAISVLVAADRPHAIDAYRMDLVEPIAFFLVLSRVVRSPRRMSMILGGLALAGCILAIPNMSIVLAAIGHHGLNVAGRIPVEIVGSANSVALFLVPLVALAGSLVVYGVHRADRLVSALFLAIALPATVLTFSRGGYLALLAVAVGLAATHPRRLLLVAWVAGGAVAVTRIPLVAARLAFVLVPGGPYNPLDTRLHLWRLTIPLLRDHPLLGTGLASFATAIRPYADAPGYGSVSFPHNLALNFWSELGLLGLVAFGWLVVEGFRAARTGWQEARPQWRPVHLGVALGLVAILVHGLVDVPYFKDDLSLELWTLLALTWCGSHWIEGEMPRRAGPPGKRLQTRNQRQRGRIRPTRGA